MRMKWLACLLVTTCSFVIVNAQSTRREQQGNFVVILGAFGSPENASKFARQASKDKFLPQVELNAAKNLYYVLVLQTDDHEAAVGEARRIQDNTRYKDAWVFTRVPVVKQEPIVEVREEVKEPVVVVPEPEIAKPVILTAQDSTRMRDEHIKAQVDKQEMAMKKGEMERLDYIFFFKDAAVLRPESRFEVDRLYNLMKQFPTEKIRIHGHTNGNDPGKIIRKKPGSTDFFSMDNTEETSGSAKLLSELRATIIRDYLITKGINKKRMEIKAWGGKKPLYNVDDDKAEANVRVEIEVLKGQD